MSFAQEAQNLAPSALVSLYQLDTTPVGGPVYHFTTETNAGNEVKFGGVSYVALPIEISGMAISGQGSIQTPTLTIANTDQFIQEAMNSFGNLEGSKLTRVRVFAKHLDGQPEADPTAFYGPDTYVIDRKSADTPEEIQFELSALIDQQGVYVGRVLIRDTCMWRYRQYIGPGKGFDYTHAKCPYAGGKYFDENDKQVTDPAKDKPSRTLQCCRLRFGRNAALPFGGFPGIVRGM